MEDAKAIKDIKEQIHIPIVADIHFDYRIAICAIEAGVDKVRINPGNIGSKEKVKAVVDKCKEYNVPIRIGVNAGSLEKDLLEKYGGKPTAKAMVESAKRHVQILEDLDFYDIAISLKASNLDICIESYEEAAKTFNYPLHLGITEAGTAFSGTIKSSIGLGILLREGIGDTIRVSLSDNPIEEIKVVKEILKDCNLYTNVPTLVSCPTCGRTQIYPSVEQNHVGQLRSLPNMPRSRVPASSMPRCTYLSHLFFASVSRITDTPSRSPSAKAISSTFRI